MLAAFLSSGVPLVEPFCTLILRYTLGFSVSSGLAASACSSPGALILQPLFASAHLHLLVVPARPPSSAELAASIRNLRLKVLLVLVEAEQVGTWLV